MKKYTKTHKTKEAQDNHIKLIKKRGGHVELWHQGGSRWSFQYWFGEKQKPGPKPGVKTGKQSKERLLGRISVLDFSNQKYSIINKYEKWAGKTYLASKILFPGYDSAKAWISENIDLSEEKVFIAHFIDGYMPYTTKRK